MENQLPLDRSAPASPCSSIGDMDERLLRILGMDFTKDSESTEVSEDGLEAVQVSSLSVTRRKKKVSDPIVASLQRDDNVMANDITTFTATMNNEFTVRQVSVSESNNGKRKSLEINKEELLDLIPLKEVIRAEVGVEPDNESLSAESVDKCDDVKVVEEVVDTVSDTVIESPEDRSPSNDTMLSSENVSPSTADVSPTTAATTEVKPAIKMRDKKSRSERRNPIKRVSFEIDLIAKDLNMNFYGPQDEQQPNTYGSNNNDGDEEAKRARSIAIALERGDPEGQENPSMTSSTQSLSSTDDKSLADDSRLSKKFTGKPRRSSSSVFRGLPKVKVTNPNETSRRFAEELSSELKQCKHVTVDDGEVNVDNNTLLRLMLDVFTDDCEQLYKVYHSRIGHTEDRVKLVFIVMTDRRVYFLEHRLHDREFVITRVIQYCELDFIMLGINYQTIVLVCKRRRKKYTFCTRNEHLTRQIVSSLEMAFRRWCPGEELPCIFNDSVMQMIGLKKWLSNETGVEKEDVSIVHYSLVEWEDPEAANSLHCPAGPSKDGYLMFCSALCDAETNLVTRTSWAPAYFVLRAGVLYQFADKGNCDLQAYIRLQGSEFQGCRRVQNHPRPHVFELILQDGRVLQLAAANDYEASDWLQAFLQTVSEKMHPVFSKFLRTLLIKLFSLEETTVTESKPCTSCCLVLTAEKVFVCQEDLDLFTFTTLGVANIHHLTAIHVDSDEASYCILEFESVEASVCAGDWIVYFSCTEELSKFTDALEKCWKNFSKLPLPKLELVSEGVREKCRDRVQNLRSSWKLGFDMLREPCSTVKHSPSCL